MSGLTIEDLIRCHKARLELLAERYEELGQRIKFRYRDRKLVVSVPDDDNLIDQLANLFVELCLDANTLLGALGVRVQTEAGIELYDATATLNAE